MSVDDFEHFQKLEDASWAARAEAAERRGQSVGHDEAMRHLTEGLEQPE
jgi:hypothetical protein